LRCSKCGSENNEDSLFCNKCGSKLSNYVEQSSKSNRFLNKRYIILGCSILIIGIAVVVFLTIFTNPVFAFKNDINNNKIEEATKIYNDKIKGNSEKVKNVESFLKDEITNILQSFKKGKTDYDTAKNKLETIQKTELVSTKVNNALSDIDNINNSRISFKKAEAFEKSNNYIDAIKEYKNVIRDDSNFETAQKRITPLIKKYKENVLKLADESASKKNYDKSVSSLNEALSLMPNDSDIIAKLSVYEKLLSEKKAAEEKVAIQKAKSEQLVVVESANIIVQDSTYKALYPDMIQVIVKNNSDKTIKNMKVGSLGFDSNGYPVKIKTEFRISDGDYEFVGNAEDVNILPGQVFGRDNGWKLDENHGISKVLSCVKTVTYYDGTTWDNPYYQYWLNEYKENPLK
jgi:hypothetical protein